MLNRSFYEVFENGDKKWLVTYADVALNGNFYMNQFFKNLTSNFTNFKPEHCIALMVMFSSYMIVQLQKNDESSEESLNDDTLDCEDAQTVN